MKGQKIILNATDENDKIREFERQLTAILKRILNDETKKQRGDKNEKSSTAN